MIQRSQSLTLSLLVACIALQGCQSVKKTLGIDRDPPNEYAVTPSVQPLEMPPDFSCLPTPMPGIERPQDRAARNTQEEKFLGSPRNKESLSAGQRALLNMSGAEANQDHIRSKVDTEARMEGNKEKTIVEQLGIKKTKPKGEALNPYDELERQKQDILPNPQPLRQVLPPSAARHNKPPTFPTSDLAPPKKDIE